MSLVINHNMMAANTARTLNSHYANLSRSTQRLSSGLRINSAADDAAGLAIRELQRADVAALKQGVRNANDAISLIQTADGALQVIDEKLIRMKELAEQSATGTYDSTQRMLIDSEYQAMAAEITRIAKATDFNGIHLLNGNLASAEHDGSGTMSTGKMKVHFGTGNDCAEDYYYIQIKETTAGAFSLGNESTWDDAVGRFADDLRNNLKMSLQGKIGDGTNGTITRQVYDNILSGVDAVAAQLAQSGKVADQTVLGGRISNTQLESNYKMPSDFNKLSDDDRQKLSYAFGRDVINNLATGGDLSTWMVYGNDTETEPGTLNGLADVIGTTAATKAQADAALAYASAADTYVAALNGGAATDAERTSFANAAAAYKAAGGTVSADIDTAAAAFLGGPSVATRGALDVLGSKISDESTKLKASMQPYVDAGAAVTAAQADLATAQANKLAADAAAATNDNAWITAKNADDAALAKLNAADNYLAAATAYDGKVTAGTVTDGDRDAFAAAAHAYEAAGGALDGAVKTAVDNYLAGNTAATSADLDAASGDGLTDATTVQADDDDHRNNATTGTKAAADAAELAKKATDDAKALTDKAFNDATATLAAAEADQLAKIPGGGGAVADIVNAAARQAAQNFVKTYDYDGMNIATQENAQIALDAINNAIVEKDKIRANLGALQNRLENTISNLNIQAENLQSAESRISDVDVSTEMTEFVRNQILAQSATAMLSQANSLPRMATQIIGG